MTLVEEWPRHVDRSPQALSGIRSFNCDWVERKIVSPRMGDVHPDEEDLFVDHIHEEGWGSPADLSDTELKKCKLLVRYSTRTPYRPIRSTDIGVEMLETTGFRTWKNAGTKSVMRMSVPYGVMDHTYETVTFVDPRPIMNLVLNCVNAMPWEGFNRGCVLYLGGKVRSEFTNLGEEAWRTWHRFWIRTIDWNQQYREAKQARDAHGGLSWDPETSEPILVDGVAGTSGWDWLLPHLYSYANLNVLYLVR